MKRPVKSRGRMHVRADGDLKPMTTPSTEESLRDYRKHIEKLKREAVQASALHWEQSLQLIGGQRSG